VLRLFTDTVAKWYRDRHAERGLPDGETGAVTAIQSANIDLRLSPHFRTPSSTVSTAPTATAKAGCSTPRLAPSQEDIERLVERASKRSLRFLERRGVIGGTGGHASTQGSGGTSGDGIGGSASGK